MTKQQKRAAKNVAMGRAADATTNAIKAELGKAGIVAQPNPDAPTTALPLDLAPPPGVDAVVGQPAKDSEKPAKVKVPFVYDRDAINAAILAEKALGVVRLHPNKAKYVKATATSADQRSVFDNGDEVAALFRGVDVAEVWTIAEQHLAPEVVAAKKAKYAGKNVGMVRMNVGNLVRGAIRAKARAKTLADAAAAAAQPKTEAQQ